MSFKVGDLVFAKVRGFPAWPSRITAIPASSGTRFSVMFYGTYEVATVNENNVWTFSPVNEKRFATKTHLRKEKFADGMREIQSTPEVIRFNDAVSDNRDIDGNADIEN